MTHPLFAPFDLGAIQLANRFVRSATWEGMADPDGGPTPQMLETYRQLAAGGCGLLITGYVCVDPLGLQYPGTLRLDQNAGIEPMRALPAAVHQAGSTIVAQLFHGGGQTGPRALGRPGLAPTAMTFPSYDGQPEALTEPQIQQLVQAFADAAVRARQAGFDGVQFHAAHGYLIHQFLSPLTNQRSDRYGGSAANRMRFLIEMVEQTRQTTGEEFLLLVKLNADDHLEEGFGIEDAIQVAKALEAAGINAIEVSAGSPASGKNSPVRTQIVAGENEGFNAEQARQIRAEVTLPILTVGGLRSLEAIEALYEQGVADLFSLSRPLIREPELIQRWQQGVTEPATCISCNGCFRPGLKGLGIRCTIDHPMES